MDLPVLANDEAFSHHAPSWWGSRPLIYVEGTAFAILALSYFYIWWNFGIWPPPRTHHPDLGVSSINLVVLAMSATPFWNAGRLGRALHDCIHRAAARMTTAVVSPRP